MAKKIPKIFLSYSWRNRDVADQIDDDFKRFGINLIRDVTDAEDFKSITEFIWKVTQTDYVIFLISKEYLESRFCLYEVIELLKANKFEKRALPVILESAEYIYEPSVRARYYDYWKNKLKEIKKLAKKYQKSDFVLESEKIEFINLYLNDFFKKFIDLKTRKFKSLKQENYHSLFKILKYSDAPLLEELMIIDKIENLEERKVKIDDFLIRYPRFSEAIYLKALICNDLKQFTEAKHYYKKVTELDETHDVAFTSLGALLSNVDHKYDEALSYFERAIQINPLNEIANQNIGIVYNNKLEHVQAAAQFKKVIEINPTNTFAIIELAGTYDILKNYQKAIHYYEAAIKLGTKETSVYLACALLQRDFCKNPEVAVSLLKKALEIDNNNYDLHITLALILRENIKDYENAISILKNAALIDQKKSFPYRHIGAIYGIELHDYELARKYYLRSIEVEPNNSQSYCDLALLHENYLNDYSSAKWYLERALSIDENNTEANARYGALFAKHFKRYDDAKEYLERALRLEPNHEAANFDYASILTLEDKADLALIYFIKVLAINPYNKEALYNVGVNYLNRGENYDEAAQYFLKLIDLDYWFPNAHFNLAQIYFQERKNKLAKAHYEQEIKINPENPESYISLGTLMNDRFNEPEQARRNFEKAVERNPSDFFANYNLGIAMEKLEGVDIARPHLQKAKDLYHPRIRREDLLFELDRFLIKQPDQD